MNDRYRVKWRGPNGQTKFGIYEDARFLPDDLPPLPAGFNWIAEAITGKFQQVSEKLIVDIPYTDSSLRRVNRMTGEVLEPGDEFEQYMARMEAEAEARVAALPKGLCVGKFFHLGVADGSATYEIVRISKATVKVEWRGYWNGDRYVDRALGHECTVTRDWARAMIEREDGRMAAIARARERDTPGFRLSPIMEQAAIPSVPCSLCGKPCAASRAHLHQGTWIGDECCWDERLRASE